MEKQNGLNRKLNGSQDSSEIPPVVKQRYDKHEHLTKEEKQPVSHFWLVVLELHAYTFIITLIYSILGDILSQREKCRGLQSQRFLYMMVHVSSHLTKHSVIQELAPQTVQCLQKVGRNGHR